MSKKHSIRVVIPFVLLIMLLPLNSYSQGIKDTLTLDESAMDNTVFYSAKDSIYSDLKEKKIHLFNEAVVDNGEVKIEAGYILIDLDKKEVYASYIYDLDSNKIQKPHFTDGSEQIDAASIRYNFDTEKGYIQEVAIKQDENFLYMGIAKRHSNEEVHFIKGRFTSCNLEDPHYHFQLSKAVMIPEKRIVSGPMNVWVKGVPMPLGLPFAVIPQVDGKTQGLIFPGFDLVTQYGFGFQDLGYYVPINDRLQTTFYGTLFSRGSWGLKNKTDYAVRYKYNGNVELGYQELKSGFPENSSSNKFTVRWTHNKDVKSSPYWRFNASVNFNSDNTTKNNLEVDNSQYFNNAFNSDINLNRQFPGKPFTAGIKLSLRQSSLAESVTLTSPIVNFNTSRFFPFKKFTRKTNALSMLGVTYSFQGKNTSKFGDSTLMDGDFDRISNSFLNGISQNVKVQTTFSLFKRTWKLNPSIDYGNLINFQYTEKLYDTTQTGNIAVDTIGGFGMAQTFRAGANLTSSLYSYYKYIGKRETVLRHVLSPSFGFSFIPKLNSVDSVYNGTSMIPYSRFERSAYTSSSTNDQALITFNFANTFELKWKSDKDTITGYKKTRIVDALSISGNYDLLKTTKNLSNINLNLRVSPISWLNFVAVSTLSPYGWSDSTGLETEEYAVKENGTLGRLVRNSFTTTLSLTSKESRKKLHKAIEGVDSYWNSDYEYYMLHPEFALDFAIPWKVSFSHVYTINLNTDQTTYSEDRWNQVQTIMVNGDLSFTKRWKLAATINTDIKEIKVTNARFTLTRDMHCWALSFMWIPIGGNQSFMFSLRSTSPLLQDAKLDLRRPPAFL